VNSWLHDHGYLQLRDGLKPGPEAHDYPSSVDWSQTRAYALGLAGIYLNLEGREAQGIVKPGDAASLRDEIARGMTGLVDKAHGTLAVRAVKTREELYHGPFAAESPDLVLHLAQGYRVSWEAALGGVPSGLFADNRKKWSGDHIVDPALVPGVLLMNRAFRGDGASLLDLAPTILDALGLPPGPAMEGSSLLR
jgi:predicted AlkP superfamily phosphohydrolase/phosphomutase